MTFELDSLLVTFIVLNIVNVILQTVKSIATVKCGKWIASFVNAITYGVYTVVICYTVSDLPMGEKIIVVALCNLVGVFIVKLIEEKSRKDKLWLVKITIPADNFDNVKQELKNKNISCSYNDLTKYFVFDCYCETQKETSEVLDISKKYHGKSFATENKLY